MNTYLVTLYQQGSVAPYPTYSTQAHEYVFTDRYVLFMDNSTPRAATVLAVPLELNPVIVRTATA